MYKIIATDLDGTLLNSKKTISEDTINVLTKLNEQGIIFVPSTGRTHNELPKPVRDLPFLNYGLCVNGGVLYDYKNKCFLYEKTIPKDRVLALLDFLQDKPVYSSVIIEGERFIQGDENGDFTPYVKNIAVPDILKIAHPCLDLSEKVKEINKDVEKLLLYPTKKELRDPCMDTIKEHFPDLEVSTSGPLYIEINVKGIDKGEGLRRLCDYLDIDIKDTIAFGDAGNDLALLDAAGLAIVMANGTEEAKSHADRICESCDEDGLRKELERVYQL